MKSVGDFNKRLVSEAALFSSHFQLHMNKDELRGELESPKLGFCQVRVTKEAKGIEDEQKMGM